MSNIIRSAKITAIAFIMCVAAFCIHVISLYFIPEEIACMNPLLSGFLHQSMDHLMLNMIVLFVSMLNPVNAKCDWKLIFFVTTLISILYLPVEILGITSFAIGLSGSCYFFLTRAMINWGIIGKTIIFVLALSEIFSITSTDSTAHGVHVIGIVLGIISNKLDKKQKGPDLPGPSFF